MKRLFISLLPILITVTIIFTIFGFLQVAFEEEKQLDEMNRRARALVDSMELPVKNALLIGDVATARYLTAKFEARERVQGCVIYDRNGNIFAITKRFEYWKDHKKPYLDEVLKEKNQQKSLIRVKNIRIFSYISSITDVRGRLIGAIEILYDTSYFFTNLTEIWRRISITLFVLITSIALILFFLQRQMFTMPVLQITSWFQSFQKGETGEIMQIKDKGELGKLASEVEQVALSLKVARKAISEEAEVRIQKEDVWTESKLKDLIHARMGDNPLIVVSNREPYIHTMDRFSKEATWTRPASGVVTAIDPILRACGGTWVAHGSGNADRKFVNSKDKLGVPPDDHRYILKRVWLNKEEEDGYYYGFSNEGLWPLCHITYTRPIFKETDWQQYVKVNQKFADAIIEELPDKSPLVFIQDYHFTLLGKMIKQKRPDAKIALFWHIPWPNPEVFSICPFQQEILDGMLGCDLIGFHVQFHCNNFLDTVNRLLEARVDTEKFSVTRNDKETLIRAFPISVDYSLSSIPEKDEEDTKRAILSELGIEDKIIMVGVDRIDYTKGLLERVFAIDRFLEKYPQFKEKFVFIQLAAPSRTHIKRYHDLISEIDELIEKKNWKYQEGSWKPIIYLKKHFSPEEIKPYYSLADICVVSSLHDGMNLVAKEYVASKNDLKGALILSKFTGAARELTDAILINPYSIEEFADAIKFAIEMPAAERKQRMERMRKQVSENNVYKWAGGIISELTSIK